MPATTPKKKKTNDRVSHLQPSTRDWEVEPSVGNVLDPESLLCHPLDVLDNTTPPRLGEELLSDSAVRSDDFVGMGTPSTLSGIPKVSLKEFEILVCFNKAEHKPGSRDLWTELGNVGVNAGLVDEGPALLSIEFEESPFTTGFTTGGSNGRTRVDRAADDASLFHVEGKVDQRGVLLCISA